MVAGVLARMHVYLLQARWWYSCVVFEFAVATTTTKTNSSTTPINMVHGSSNTGNRTADTIGDYRPGSIRRVKLQNFLTHGNVEFKPGPRYVPHHFLVTE